MNIWGLLFIIVSLLWLFIEYLRYVKNRIIEIIKEYKILQEKRKELLEEIRGWKNKEFPKEK